MSDSYAIDDDSFVELVKLILVDEVDESRYTDVYRSLCSNTWVHDGGKLKFCCSWHSAANLVEKIYAENVGGSFEIVQGDDLEGVVASWVKEWLAGHGWRYEN